MLDLKKIREKPEELAAMLSKRGIQNPWQGKDEGLIPPPAYSPKRRIYDSQAGGGMTLEKFFEEEKKYRNLLQEVEKLRAEKSQLSEKFGKLKREGMNDGSLIQQIEKINTRLVEKGSELGGLETKLNSALLLLPNFPDDSVPEGKSPEQNRVVRNVGELPSFSFESRTHWEIGESLGILDFASAGKISGSRFAVLKGAGAALERALISFMMDLHIAEHGYTEIFAPYLVNYATMQGTGQLPKFEEEMFKMEKDELFLIPTAEVSVTNLHRDEIFEESELPLKYVCYSACFRREAGSYGKDTKGLIRNHQFNKVELVWFSTPQNSFADLEKLTQHAEKVLQKIGIPYRVVELCTGDLGFASAKTYDLEVWMPGEKRWREISSCSCFTDFQARRMNIKYKSASGKREFVHTLNGSGVAVGRLFASILENYQQKDGSVLVPEVLRSYLKADKIGS